jgi:hypothetical protein
MKFKSFSHFINEGDTNVEKADNDLTRTLSEYHNALKKVQELESRFVNTPKEKINEREKIKQALIQANRDMLSKQSEFHYFLAETGDGDIFNDNSNQH